MRKNSDLMVVPVGNGFLVYPAGQNQGVSLRDPALVFESRDALLFYMKQHFDMAKEPKVDP